ncbi:MAG: flagellar basal body L-ring protein FlgH [Polyangiaceae bacterium]|nr:flagellar basal body L-ring protein FlgH [Polyangiaceae bacterium]
MTVSKEVSRWVGVWIGVSLLSGCYSSVIQEPPRVDRDYEVGRYAADDAANAPSVGSLYSQGRPGLLQDTRALRVGDMVMIKIAEHADAKGGASTKLSRSSDRESGVKEFLGLVDVIQAQSPELDPSTLWKLVSAYEFAAEGKTSREGSLRGLIGVRVKEEMPNGDLYVEGTKVVMINHEEYHLYISGVVRPADIQEDNSVESTLIADSRVEFTGRGEIEEQTQQGWMSWFLNKIRPF